MVPIDKLPDMLMDGQQIGFGTVILRYCITIYIKFVRQVPITTTVHPAHIAEVDYNISPGPELCKAQIRAQQAQMQAQLSPLLSQIWTAFFST